LREALWGRCVRSCRIRRNVSSRSGEVVADGEVTGDYDAVTVSSGTITLDDNYAVVHVGLPYEGILKTHNLDMGGRTGPASMKPRNISAIGIRFLNSMGCRYGTDVYHTESVSLRDDTMDADRPIPVFSGVRTFPYSDSWSSVETSGEKAVVVIQQLPQPCIVQGIDIDYETGDE